MNFKIDQRNNTTITTSKSQLQTSFKSVNENTSI